MESTLHPCVPNVIRSGKMNKIVGVQIGMNDPLDFQEHPDEIVFQLVHLPNPPWVEHPTAS